MKSSKKLCPRFLITFLLFEILAFITFLFPLKAVLKTKCPSQHQKTAHLKNSTFFEELQARFCLVVISSNVHHLRQSNFQLELKHGTLTEDTHSRLESFIGTVTLIHIQH